MKPKLILRIYIPTMDAVRKRYTWCKIRPANLTNIVHEILDAYQINTHIAETLLNEKTGKPLTNIIRKIACEIEAGNAGTRRQFNSFFEKYLCPPPPVLRAKMLHMIADMYIEEIRGYVLV